MGLGMGICFAAPHLARWSCMDVTDDISNIALLCFVLGIGFLTFIGVALAYITTLFLMESFNDRD